MAEKIDLGELELSITANTKGLKSVGGSIRALRADLQKDMAAIANSMKAMEKGMQSIATATTKSTQTVTRSQGNVKQSLDRTQKALFSVANKYRDLSVSTRLAALSADQKTTALGQLDSAYRRVMADLKAANGDTNKITAAMQRFANSSKNVTRTTREWGAALKKTAAKKAADDIKKMGLSTTDLSKAVQVALGPLSGIASRITAIAGLANRNTLALAGMTAAIIAFGAITFKAVKLAADYEKQMRQLSNRAAIFGREIGVATHELDAMAVSLGTRTLASAEGARQALVTLTGIVGITKDNLEEALEASQRLADAGFGNLRTSARRLTRVLSDPVQAMESLRTMGVRLTFSQRELAKDMLAVGNISGAQTLLLDALRSAHEGVNGAIDTTAGAYDDLLEKSKRFFQNMGTQGGILDPVTEGLKEITKEIERSFGPNAFGSVERFSVVMRATLQGLVGILKFVISTIDFLGITLISLFAGATSKAIIFGIGAISSALLKFATTLKLVTAAAALTKVVAFVGALAAVVPVVVAAAVAGIFMFGVFSKKREFRAIDDLKKKLEGLKGLQGTDLPKMLADTQAEIKARTDRLKIIQAEIDLRQKAMQEIRQSGKLLKGTRIKLIADHRGEIKKLSIEEAALIAVLKDANTTVPAAVAALKALGIAGTNAGTHISTLTNQLEKLGKATTSFSKGSEFRRNIDAIDETRNILAQGTQTPELLQTLKSIAPGANLASDALDTMNEGLIHTKAGLLKLKTDRGSFQIIDSGGLAAVDEANLKVKQFTRLLSEGLLEEGATVNNFMSKFAHGYQIAAGEVAEAVKQQDHANRQLRDLNTVLNDIDQPMDAYIRKLKIINGLNTSQDRKNEAARLAREGMTQEIALREKLNLAQGRSDALLNAGLRGLEDYNHEAIKYSHLLAQKLIPDTATMENMYEKLIPKSEKHAKAFIMNADAARLLTQQTDALQKAMEINQTPVEALNKQIRDLEAGYDGTSAKAKEIKAAISKLTDDFTEQSEALKKVALEQGRYDSLLNNGLAGQREYALQAEIYTKLLAGGLIPKTATLANMYEHLGHLDRKKAVDTINATRAIHDQTNKTSDYKQLLEDIQTPYDKYLEKIARLNALLNENTKLAPQVAKGILEAQKQLRDAEPALKAVTEAFNGITDAIADMVVSGEQSFADFGVIIDQFVRDTMSKLIKLTLFKPIQDAFLGFATSVMGAALPTTPGAGGFSDALTVGPGASPGLAQSFAASGFGFAKGGAWSHGVRKLGKGGLLDGPTLFGSKGGMNLAGEAGTEAVMPLTRTANGDLGVAAVGGSGGAASVVVNVINNTDAQATVTQTNSGGQEKIDITIDRVVSGLLSNPRSRVSNAMSRSFNTSPKLVGR